MTSAGLRIKQGRVSLAVLQTDEIHGDPSILQLHSTVSFVLSGRSPGRYRNVGDLLRDPVCPVVSGQARVVAVPTLAASERYVYLGSGGETGQQVPPESSVIIDQSVLIDAEQALRQAPPHAEKLSVLRDRLAWLQDVDTVPGFGIAEAFDAGPDGPKHARSLRAAWDAWMGSDPGATPLADIRSDYESRMGATDQSHDAWVAEQAERGPGRLIDLNYLTILEAIHPWAGIRGRRFVQSQRVAAFLDWIERMNMDHAGMPGHAGAAVRHLLLGKGGPSESAAKLLKLHKEPPFERSELRGAAHDMLYVTIADMAQAGARPTRSWNFQDHVVVLTADKEMVSARQRVALAATVADNDQVNGVVGIATPYEVLYSARNQSRIAAADLALETGSWRRSTLGDRTTERTARIAELEYDLLDRRLLAPLPTSYGYG